MLYLVDLNEEPRAMYNALSPADGEDVEELYWLGTENLYVVQSGGRLVVKFKSNPDDFKLTHMNEAYVLPKLIALGLLPRPPAFP